VENGISVHAKIAHTGFIVCDGFTESVKPSFFVYNTGKLVPKVSLDSALFSD
jgi:hypothetical protein